MHFVFMREHLILQPFSRPVGLYIINVHMSGVKLNILVWTLFYTVYCWNVLNKYLHNL